MQSNPRRLSPKRPRSSSGSPPSPLPSASVPPLSSLSLPASAPVTALPSIRTLHPHLPPAGHHYLLPEADLTGLGQSGYIPSFQSSSRLLDRSLLSSPSAPVSSSAAASGSSTDRLRLHQRQRATSIGPDSDGDQNDLLEQTEPPKKKRRRQALSCTECKRRKIKCDRNQPCGPCTRRNELHKCHWHVVEPIEKYVTRAEWDDLYTRFKHLEDRFMRLESFFSMHAGRPEISVSPVSGSLPQLLTSKDHDQNRSRREFQSSGLPAPLQLHAPYPSVQQAQSNPLAGPGVSGTSSSVISPRLHLTPRMQERHISRTTNPVHDHQRQPSQRRMSITPVPISLSLHTRDNTTGGPAYAISSSIDTASSQHSYKYPRGTLHEFIADRNTIPKDSNDERRKSPSSVDDSGSGRSLRIVSQSNSLPLLGGGGSGNGQKNPLALSSIVGTENPGIVLDPASERQQPESSSDRSHQYVYSHRAAHSSPMSSASPQQQQLSTIPSQSSSRSPHAPKNAQAQMIDEAGDRLRRYFSSHNLSPHDDSPISPSEDRLNTSMVRSDSRSCSLMSTSLGSNFDTNAGITVAH